jgi:hypothetical protein
VGHLLSCATRIANVGLGRSLGDRAS